jgi:predicted acetyltransferase
MQEIRLILPIKKYKNQVESYKKSMIEIGSAMSGCGTLDNDDFDTWLKKSRQYMVGENLPKGKVQATQFICVRKSDDKIIGMTQIRHTLNNYLLDIGGHIGYSIAAEERRKGYGKAMLKLGLAEAKKLGLKKVLVSCQAENIASEKCITANGGVYEDTRKDKWTGQYVKRFWIDLS